MIQSSGLNIFFDLSIPGIGLHFSEPPCKLALFRVRELFNLGLNVSYSAHSCKTTLEEGFLSRLQASASFDDIRYCQKQEGNLVALLT